MDADGSSASTCSVVMVISLIVQKKNPYASQQSCHHFKWTISMYHHILECYNISMLNMALNIPTLSKTSPRLEWNCHFTKHGGILCSARRKTMEAHGSVLPAIVKIASCLEMCHFLKLIDILMISQLECLSIYTAPLV